MRPGTDAGDRRAGGVPADVRQLPARPPAPRRAMPAPSGEKRRRRARARSLARRPPRRPPRTAFPGRRSPCPQLGPSSAARAQWRDASMATGPLMPKCVHSREPVSRMRRACQPTPSAPRRERRPRAGRAGLRSDGERHGARRVVSTMVGRDGARSEARAVAAGLGKRLAAGRHDHRPAAMTPSAPAREPRGSPRYRRHGDRWQLDPDPARIAEQRVKNVTGAFRSGNSLPSASSCSATPSSRKNRPSPRPPTRAAPAA